MDNYFKGGGKILVYSTCLSLRSADVTDRCPLSTLKDLHQIVKESDAGYRFEFK